MDVMQTLEHPNIVKLFETFEDSQNFWLVLELCEGGRVDHFVARTGDFTEKDASRIMKQVLGATKYLHGRSICHRDLKPQNLLFRSSCPIESNTVKVADFGIACACPQGRELKEKLGSLEYMAPEVLAGRYNLAADIWSCGVVLYMLLCGNPPFQGDSEEKLMAVVRRGNYCLHTEAWSEISAEAKSMVRGLLKMSVDERWTADQACEQNWVCNGAERSTQLKGAVRNIRRRSSFKRSKQNAAPDRMESLLSQWMGPMVGWASAVMPDFQVHCGKSGGTVLDLPSLFQCHSSSATNADEEQLFNVFADEANLRRI